MATTLAQVCEIANNFGVSSGIVPPGSALASAKAEPGRTMPELTPKFKKKQRAALVRCALFPSPPAGLSCQALLQVGFHRLQFFRQVVGQLGEQFFVQLQLFTPGVFVDRGDGLELFRRERDAV